MALLIVIDCTFFWNKEQYFFLKHESVYSEVCNFLGCYLAELSAFFFFFYRDALLFDP